MSQPSYTHTLFFSSHSLTDAQEILDAFNAAPFAQGPSVVSTATASKLTNTQHTKPCVAAYCTFPDDDTATDFWHGGYYEETLIPRSLGCADFQANPPTHPTFRIPKIVTHASLGAIIGFPWFVVDEGEHSLLYGSPEHVERFLQGNLHLADYKTREPFNPTPLTLQQHFINTEIKLTSAGPWESLAAYLNTEEDTLLAD